jgi:hypothetical protein
MIDHGQKEFFPVVELLIEIPAQWIVTTLQGHADYRAVFREYFRGSEYIVRVNFTQVP